MDTDRKLHSDRKLLDAPVEEKEEAEQGSERGRRKVYRWKEPRAPDGKTAAGNRRLNESEADGKSERLRKEDVKFPEDSGQSADGENRLTTPSRRQSAQVRVHDTNQNEKKFHVLASDTSKRDGRSTVTPERRSGWAEEPAEIIAPEETFSEKSQRKKTVTPTISAGSLG